MQRGGKPIEVIVCDARMLPFRDGVFKTVVSNSVLEHTTHVNLLLGEVSRCLCRGGGLLATVPSENFGSFLLLSSLLNKVRLSGLASRYGNLINAISIHHNVLPLLEWQALLASSGLTLLESREYMSRTSAQVGDLIWLATTFTPLGVFYRRTGKGRGLAKSWLLRYVTNRSEPGAGLFLRACRVLGGDGWDGSWQAPATSCED